MFKGFESPFEKARWTQARLPPPEPVPLDEWTKAERERGETFPEHRTPLRARLKTPEQQNVYKELQEEVRALEGELFDRWREPWNLSQEDHNEIVRRYEAQFTNIAAKARVLADSYRKFDVGALVVGFQDPRIEQDGFLRFPSSQQANPWRILFDANTRPETDEGIVVGQHGAKESGRKSEVRKYCAELYLSDRVDPNKPECGEAREKLTKAIALFVVGKAQMDDDSKVRQISLTCCKLCRDRLWKMTQVEDDSRNKKKPVYAEDMPVISADSRSLNNRKWQPVNRLHKFHGELPPGYEEI